MVPHGFDPWDIGSEIGLIISIPGERPFLAHGILRHQNERAPNALFGVEFTQLPDAGRDLLETYVSRREGDGSRGVGSGS